jgi:hypothetical protein
VTNMTVICATSLFNPLKPKRERERESHKGEHKSRSKEKTSGGKREALYIWGGKKSILLEGTQAMPASPSDKDRMGVKTLGWWVVKAWDRDGRILFDDSLLCLCNLKVNYFRGPRARGNFDEARLNVI